MGAEGDAEDDETNITVACQVQRKGRVDGGVD